MGNVVAMVQTPKMGKSKQAPPRRVANLELRSREYLTPTEVEKLIVAAKNTGRHGHRDSTFILLSFRHAMRVSEIVAWRRDQINLEQGTVHINRLKNGTPSIHPLRGPEIRAIRKLYRDYPDSAFVFSTERGGPMTAATARKMIQRAGEVADLGFSVHPHMLRHACGYYLANKGTDTRAIQSYLGHRQIAHSATYTAMSSDRFKDFWRD
jgi:type 1 fimbriae regulatory protein FimB/type 1 fimbriae regulatory protein FimE